MSVPPSPIEVFFLSRARAFKTPACQSAGLRDTLHLALAARLEQICLPLLRLEYALFRHACGFFPAAPQQEPDEEFLARLDAGGGEELLVRRPVLERLVNLAVEQWRITTTELLVRLAQDADALHAIFGVAGTQTDIRLGISDPHNGGRSAAMITFSDGRRLVYKPKDLSPDRAWRNFSLWLKHNGAPWHPAPQNILERDGYGWAGFVESRPCESTAEEAVFFYRLGQLQALLYLLGATDCHRDNFIVHGPEPVLIDLETLLHPQPPNDPMPRALRQSVLSVEILPCSYIGAGQQEIYLPGFDQEWHQGTRLGTSTLELRTHAEPFGCGFDTMYRFLLRHQVCLSDLDSGPLAAFRACTVRYVHRPTTTYALTLRRALRHLDQQHEGGMSFELMHRFDLPGLSEESAQRLHGAEHAAMRQLDIPFFTARSDATALHWQGGGLIKHFFTEPALELARQRVLRLSEEDLAWQLEAIHQSLRAVARDRGRD